MFGNASPSQYTDRPFGAQEADASEQQLGVLAEISAKTPTDPTNLERITACPPPQPRVPRTVVMTPRLEEP